MAFWKTMTQTICCQLVWKQLLPEENVDIFTVLEAKNNEKFRLDEDGLTVTTRSVWRVEVSAKSETTVQDSVSTFVRMKPLETFNEDILQPCSRSQNWSRREIEPQDMLSCNI